MFVLQLALIGLCVATVPLSYVWVRGDAEKFRKLLWVTTFLTLDLVMFGSFTRLTDSGLGCPDWPGCYGTSSPFIAHAAIAAAQQAMPTGPVTLTKAWIEMIHRYFATAIGALIVIQTVIAWLRRRSLPISPWWPTALLLLVCVQGAFGAWTVTQKLQPVIVTTHLLLGLALLALLGWTAAAAGARGAAGGMAVGAGVTARGVGTDSAAPLDSGASRARNVPLRRWRAAALVGLLLLILQIALGGWVSTNYAVLACTDFPTCNGQWLPPMDFAHGFHLWRALGQSGDGEMISQAALVAIHWTHRTFAVVVIAYLAWLGWRLRRCAPLRTPATWLLIMLAVQFASGLSNILLKWPLAIAVSHNGGAAVLLLLLVMLNYRIVSSPPVKAVTSPGTAAAV